MESLRGDDAEVVGAVRRALGVRRRHQRDGAADVLDERDRLVVAGRSTLSALRWLLCLQSAVESSVPGYS
ncbi:MAG: hypothetical protein IPP16_01090 [Acidimicrobiaceae bacterium]|nr:hypothetical protein [Acidimicrobiaceae bacterium]MBK9969378.1 hypothetical protein [Acidimicrobiaceae bacterium]MBP6489446.1 hypothetical protein [Ilumatobacteraceae bacterium]